MSEFFRYRFLFAVRIRQGEDFFSLFFPLGFALITFCILLLIKTRGHIGRKKPVIVGFCVFVCLRSRRRAGWRILMFTRFARWSLVLAKC